MRFLPPMSSTELSRFRGPARVVLVALVLVPAIYAGLLTWANLDVNQEMDQVPAAIVNNDEVVQVKGEDGKKQPVAIGRAIAGSLVTSDDPRNLDWEVTSAAEAKKGLADGDYYAVLTLPKDMSKDVTSTDDADTARAARMDLQTNDAISYLSGSIANTIGQNVMDETGDRVTRQYLDQVYLGFNGMHTSLADASDGAGSVADGAADLAKGSARLDDGTAELADGLGELASGSAQLADGVGRLSGGADRLSSGASELSAGAGRLSSGLDTMHDRTSQLPAQTKALADGARQVTDGATELGNGAARLGDGATRFADGLRQLSAGADRLEGGANRLSTGAGEVAGGLDTANAGADRLAGGVTAYTGGVDALSANCAASGAAPEFCQRLAAVSSRSGELRQGAGGLAAGLDPLEAGANQVATGADDLASGASDLSDGATELADRSGELASGGRDLQAGGQRLAAGGARLQDGLDRLASGTGPLVRGIADASAGADRLSSGADRLASGAGDLSTGASQAAGAADQLAAGASDARDGANRLAGGASEVADGSAQLADGSRKLANGLTEGAGEVPTYDKQQREQLADVVSTPITTASSRANEVPAFGYSLAPYFLALALWVGGMALYMVLRPLSPRTVASSAPAWRVALAGYLPGALLGLVQVGVLAAVMVWGMDLKIPQMGGFAAIAITASLAFVAINFALVALLGAPGRFVGMLLLVLQLAAAGATYPVESTPDFFQAAHPWLPLSYAVSAFRSVIAGGSVELAVPLAVLLTWLVGALLVAVWAVRRQRGSWSVQRLHAQPVV